MSNATVNALIAVGPILLAAFFLYLFGGLILEAMSNPIGYSPPGLVDALARGVDTVKQRQRFLTTVIAQL